MMPITPPQPAALKLYRSIPLEVRTGDCGMERCTIPIRNDIAELYRHVGKRFEKTGTYAFERFPIYRAGFAEPMEPAS